VSVLTLSDFTSDAVNTCKGPLKWPLKTVTIHFFTDFDENGCVGQLFHTEFHEIFFKKNHTFMAVKNRYFLFIDQC